MTDDDALPYTFETIMNVYENTWIAPMQMLRAPHPIAAVTLACIILDHIGNARRKDEPRRNDEHGTIYRTFIKTYLVPEGFPPEEQLYGVFYGSLRSGLVHNARTDDATEPHPDDAEIVRITNEYKKPRRADDGNLLISAPWLCNAIEQQFSQTRKITDPNLRTRIGGRLRMYVSEIAVTYETEHPGSFRTDTPSGSAIGPHAGGPRNAPPLIQSKPAWERLGLPPLP
jgi:hypothetical protein